MAATAADSIATAMPGGPPQGLTQRQPDDDLPPSPPATEKDPGSRTESVSDFPLGEPAPPSAGHGRYPLPREPRPDQRVLAEDLSTPDRHVARDPRLLRLTGAHPFNVEPPLTDLWDEGFITTRDLHYVRNHGAVPLVRDADVMDWALTVEGLVERPLSLTLRDLLAGFEHVTYPVTLVCAGNRRKEQNLVRKTRGFSWGAAGLSTALWTGVPLADLVARARPLVRGRGHGRPRARYVCLEGADALPNGHYGTSIRLDWATDPARGVLVAHAMNGEPLPPDHGRPLRVVVPGQIGGRSVKWLTRIVVTPDPSDNWYHIYDNRVLPTAVSPEESAGLPDVWRDERYAIYDLNTNSAVARPAHDERVDTAAAAAHYRLEGYAYAGGGRRVTRVELTLDRGRTWRLAAVSYPEDEYRAAPEGEVLFGGRLDVAGRESCFCWCLWALEVPLAELAAAGDVMVRAMDDAMAVQPRDMYWSVLGMMNNPWFRVVVHRDDAGVLRFEHPTQPVLNADGWMDRVKKEGGDLTNGFWGERAPGDEERTAAAAVEPARDISMVNKDIRRDIGLQELMEHGGEEEPWFVLDGEVYDGTRFLQDHPGGAASIIGAAGQDVVEEFMAIHSENAKAMMPSYHIGTLDAASSKTLAAGTQEPRPPGEGPRAVFLDPGAWRKARLTAKRPVSPDTKVFTFALDHPSQALGLPTGQHLMARLRDPASREAIIRAYTPLSDDDDDHHHGDRAGGRLDLLVKVYRGGLMTQALDAVPLGHWVEFRGPVGRHEYLGRGRFSSGGRVRRVRRFVMICGGSGVTPIYAVLRAVMREGDGGDDDDDDDKAPRCVVLDGNRSEADILCRAEMDALARGREDRCRIVHTLSRPGDGWAGERGLVDARLLEREAGPPGEARDAMVLLCGPPGLEKSARQVLMGMGWREDDIASF